MDMKKHKKHQFSHTDPEHLKVQKVEGDNVKTELDANDNVPKFVYRDLKRTGYIIGIFIALLIALYFVQTKTNWLAPVLKVFGL
jgi:uncharacterized membrane protein